jgi:hypothetical protein
MANAEERDRPEDLYPFAEALVRKLKANRRKRNCFKTPSMNTVSRIWPLLARS